MQSLGRERMGQRAHDMILADQGLKRAGAPLARENQIRHGRWTLPTKNEEASLTSALTLHGCGCFVPDLTRFTAEPCEGARQPAF